MVDFNLCGRRLGAVAIFATLLVAVQVNGEKGCVFDFENENRISEYDLSCNGVANSWNSKQTETKFSDSPRRKALFLEIENEGCLKIKNPVTLNSTTKVAITVSKEGMEKDKLLVRLVPVEGTCSDEECVWVPVDSEADESDESDGWVTLKHAFPLKSTKDFNIQVEVKKGKNRFGMSSISIPNPNKPENCHINAEKKVESLDDHTVVYDKLVALELGDETSSEGSSGGPTATTHKHSTTPKSAAPGLVDMSKNFLLTSASVLVLNHLLN